jgi:NAD+ kinase
VAALFKVVGLVARIDQKEAVKLAKELMLHIEDKGISVFSEPSLAKRTKKMASALRLEEMEVDLIITIGGDGTILRACLRIPKPEPPILAINMGVRGFLTEVTPEEALQAVDRCLEGKFVIERCTKLSSSIGKEKLPDALNEVFITSRTPAKLLHTKIWRDGVAVAECRSDGVVVASQVGSTGYSLSGGGPVLDPRLEAFVLTPICPLTVFHPIVFSAKSTIGIELLKPKRAAVVVDGHYQTEMKTNKDRMTIKKSEYKSSFVRFDDDFYRRLKARLLFPRGERL